MRVFFTILILLFVAGVASFSAWLLLHDDRRLIKAEVPDDYLDTSDTSRFNTYPISLVRGKKSDSVLVIFPSTGSEGMNVSLLVYDSLQYAILMDGNRTAKPLEAATRLSRILREPLVNLSSLPDGSYFARLSSSNYSGFIHIKLRTSAD
ncbi:MAG: hypothetical protein FD123_3698 [Bacteroidetes bacterium]|nr:MAG: hypothetical protein FD123_3698 [Bacteroidota bacterium]